jgi:hypothetical protein
MAADVSLRVDLPAARLLHRALQRECRVLGAYTIQPSGRRCPTAEQALARGLAQSIEEIVARLGAAETAPLRRTTSPAQDLLAPEDLS